MSMKEYQAIVKVVETYLQGMRTGKLEYWTKAFYPDCLVIGANEENSVKSITPIMGYAKYIAEQHAAGTACEEFPMGSEIGFVGNIGRVRLDWRFVLGEATLYGTTFFNLLKRKGTWKISQKIYYVTH